ncbi:hypothetical protein EJ05DRAFT_537021 [Pseudovirgaria hyperparasitica]|uniref:Tcp11-domain-containing protein n=1 Tax=Pseudovirgaria hyperparasitica TaxID=470096 RepID=A0A6A6WD56_9PEZI|nr:uncharacterized protein EJ05DRAFT_537021 [Pseudovirgaria hyperparasitica]KAF2759786.1 hypothetical protein EJ05DRAFT_537021 [Pseudovirgaria hyperparasitica]
MAPTHDDIPEEEDDVMVANDTADTFLPPPRIAARFYRAPNNRRKSSAASSRRNSISSTTSHQSTRSYRGGCQSNLVAQSLRRASILETRKARLADRAAHAEQVRLRAAIAKSNTRASTSEERALAAKQARDKHLAQVAASCAEEVRRAKKIAEDNKERKAAEERRYRQEIEEKHAEAERRRLEYKRNMRRPRTTSTPSPDSKKPTLHALSQISENEAAKRIQSVWRSRERRKAVESFTGLGLSIDHIHDTSFEDVSKLLADEKLLAATSKLLNLFKIPGTADGPSIDQTATRTFLSAYLILGHPAEVLSKDGDQEQNLIQQAKELVMSFESALSELTSSNRFTPPPTQVETVLMAHGGFVTAFNDWKARDSTALVETMVTSFVNLDAIWQSIKDQTAAEVANDYREGIRDNQVILLSKIRKLAGPDKANFLIKKAIRESRRSRTRRKPLGDVRPRVAVDSPTALELPDTPFHDPVQVDATSRLDSLRVEAPSSAADSQNTVVSQPHASSLDAESPYPGLGASSLSQLFSTMPSNRILTHELAIDKDYRIDQAPASDLRDSMNRTICDGMQRGFENGEGAQWTAAMAENIKSRLLRLLRPGTSMHTLISETLDPQFVSNQASQGVFSYEKFFGFMSSILPKLCAPFRDAQIKALTEDLQEPGDMAEMIEKLFKLLHVIDLLSLDYSNFLLMNAAPTLIKESAGYEERMFAQDLDAGTITLQRTKRWWSNATVNMLTEATGDRRDPSNRPTPQKIYFRGLVDLSMASTPLQPSDVPETLELDKERIARFRTNTLRITTIGAILLSAKSLLKRDVRSSWKPEASRMWDILQDGYLKDESMPTKILSILESSHPMPPTTRAQLGGTVQKFLAQAQAGRLNDPVLKVIFQRLKSHVMTRVSASSSGERVRAASTASEGLASFGLPEFMNHVGEIVDGLGRIGDVDRRAHGPWYEQVQREVEAAGDDPVA